MLVLKDRAGRPMRVPIQIFLWAWPLLHGAIAWVRFGMAWGLLEGIAVYGWWLSMTFGRAAWTIWLRQHPIPAFLLLLYVFATLFFALPALFFGLLISVWWCWAIGLSGGVIVTAVVWPAQRRFWASLGG